MSFVDCALGFGKRTVGVNVQGKRTKIEFADGKWASKRRLHASMLNFWLFL